jgi:PadR family transcriptional regulator, regulatory protein PadR
MKGTHIGEFEELTLMIVAALDEDAYGVNILAGITKQTGRSPNIAAVHSVLNRLESKGYLRSKMGGATAERGGRRKRIFTITASGKKLVEQLIALRIKLYNAIPGFNLKSV